MPAQAQDTHFRPQVDVPLTEPRCAAGVVCATMDSTEKPTKVAAMLGALFILDDPIFNGLALALIFGILVSTLLTLVVIPVLYFAAFRKEQS